jgi:hypothetical protein
MNRVIISIEDNISDVAATECVLSVIKQGKISETKNKKQYCFITTFNNGIVVNARSKYNLKADSFIVYRDRNFGIKKWGDEL